MKRIPKQPPTEIGDTVEIEGTPKTKPLDGLDAFDGNYWKLVEKDYPEYFEDSDIEIDPTYEPTDEESLEITQTGWESDTSSDEELANSRRILKENDNLVLHIINKCSDDESSEDFYDTPSEDTDEELTMEKKLKNKAIGDIDASNNFKEIEWKVGMRFASAEIFKDFVTRYAAFCGYCIKWCRSTNMNKLEAKCKIGCPWKIYASWDRPREAFVVKTLNSSHTCNRADYENLQVKPRWLAKEFLMDYKMNPNLSSTYLIDAVRKRFGKTLNKYQCHRTKHAALKLLHGSVDDHYQRLGSYINELMRVDPRTSIELQTKENSIPGGPRVFRRLYMCFYGLREGFLKGCRPIICLDGCFLKTFLGGMLLCAIGRDGNNQMFPVAWAAVEAENNDSWSWFLQNLKKDLQGFGGEECTIISDQQKGLINAVREHFPLAEHRNCARHIFANWHKTHKGEQLKHAFWKAAKACTTSDFDTALEEMNIVSSRAVEDLIQQNPKTFCRSKLRTFCKSDVHVNNLAETFNGYILNARSLPLIDMMEQIRLSLMYRMCQKRELMEKGVDDICPRIRKKLEIIKDKAKQCNVIPANNNEFQVLHLTDMVYVNLEKRTCSCRQFDLTGVPCFHVVACCYWQRVQCENYVADWFKRDKYALAYEYPIHPANGKGRWEVIEYPLAPPIFKTRVGRPKKNRKKDPCERNERQGKLTRHGVQMTCQICGGKRHNKRTCPQKGSIATPSNAEHPVRKRGRPRKEIIDAASDEQYRQTRPRGRPRKGTNPMFSSTTHAIPRGMGAYFSSTSHNIYINPGHLGSTVISPSPGAPGPSQG